MFRQKNLAAGVLALLAFTNGIAFTSEIRTFVQSKPWQITINLNEFEPKDLLGPKTILGGNTKDGIMITVIVEKTKPGTKPAEIRKLYGERSASAFGQKETIQEIDVNDVAIIAYKWKHIPDRWGYHGYVVKDNVAFDIHLSTDMSRHTKKQMLEVIKSFRIKPSRELKECNKLYESLGENISSEEKEKLLSNFVKRYPTNSEVYCFLAEHYLSLQELKQTKNAYLKALQNHKIQPLINPMSLWKCYDGLGMCYGMSGEYDLCKQYIESGYNLAKKAKMPSPIIALSAYNLACLYAETNDPKNSIKYLRQSIKLNPRYKEKAKLDSSFNNIKEKQKFKDLIYR